MMLWVFWQREGGERRVSGGEGWEGVQGGGTRRGEGGGGGWGEEENAMEAAEEDA